jgi:hypothetical protein
MRHVVLLFIHFLATLVRLLGPGGVRSIVAESLLLKHQLLLLNRSRQRSPNLSAWDRILAGWMALLVRPTRLLRSAIVLKPSTLLALHKAMSTRKYRMLFSTNRRRKPGPKGPSAELVRAIVEMTTAALFRPFYPGVLIGAGGFTRQSAAEAIAARTVDAVAFGKSFIANPDLPLRLKMDTPLNQYDHSTFYGGTAKGYTDDPTLRELSSSQAQTAGVEACDLK